jgi:SAM-dependent methyltransferase
MSVSTRQSEVIGHWYQRPSLQIALECVRAELDQALPTCFGYHLVQLADIELVACYQSSKINHRVLCQPGGDLVSESEHLPFETDSVDVLIALHSLDTSSNPHQVVREIQRVLAPQGQLFLVGLNPSSINALSNVMAKITLRKPTTPKATLSVHRLDDWFRLLGLERTRVRYFAHLPYSGANSRLSRVLSSVTKWLEVHRMPAGRLYFIRATKQVSAIHRPTLARFRPRLRAIAIGKSVVTSRQTKESMRNND